jgi:hypothetical protein
MPFIEKLTKGKLTAINNAMTALMAKARLRWAGR